MFLKFSKSSRGGLTLTRNLRGFSVRINPFTQSVIRSNQLGKIALNSYVDSVNVFTTS